MGDWGPPTMCAAKHAMVLLPLRHAAHVPCPVACGVCMHADMQGASRGFWFGPSPCS